MRINYSFPLLLLALNHATFADENFTQQQAKHAIGFSTGWIFGNGVTYRHYFGDQFLQGTFFGIVTGNGDEAYINAAFSGGTYLHKLKASGIIPPMALKVMAGADLVMEKQRVYEGSSIGNKTSSERTVNENRCYYGAGAGIEIGNPGRPGLSLWIAVNYVFAFEGVSSQSFDWFGARPAAGILYGW